MKVSRNLKWTNTAALLLGLLLWCPVTSYSRITATVAILPFQTNADEDVVFLYRGISQMLMSRIAAGSGFHVIEPNVVLKMLANIPDGELTKVQILEIGKALGADHVIYGSITKFVENVSVDMNVINVRQGWTTVPIFIQCKLDELIPKISDLAQGIKDAISKELDKKALDALLGSSNGAGTFQQEAYEKMRNKIKEELKLEILAELRKEGLTGGTGQQTDREQLEEELTKNILGKLQDDKNITWARPTVDHGSAKGRILWNKKGLEGCRVKLVRMMSGGMLSEMFRNFQEGIEFETITDKDGGYVFADIPVGSYKLKWLLPGDTGWIRRIRDKPDIIIERGKKKNFKDVETNRKLLPS